MFTILNVNNNIIINARTGNPIPILNIYKSIGDITFNKYCLFIIVVNAQENPDNKANKYVLGMDSK